MIAMPIPIEINDVVLSFIIQKNHKRSIPHGVKFKILLPVSTGLATIGTIVIKIVAMV